MNKAPPPSPQTPTAPPLVDTSEGEVFMRLAPKLGSVDAESPLPIFYMKVFFFLRCHSDIKAQVIKEQVDYYGI